MRGIIREFEARGDTFHLGDVIGGIGGGYGKAFSGPPRSWSKDVLDGYLTREAAG